MPITEEQREQRRHSLGSSDAAAILGLDPWRNAADVYWEKTGEFVGEQPTNMAMEIGNVLEDSLLDWAEKQLGVALNRNVHRVSKHPEITSNNDAEIIGVSTGVEAKTAGIANPFFHGEEWGTEGTDQIPQRAVAQCLHQMFVGDFETVYVPALIGGRGFVMFQVYRDEEAIELIIERELAFWADHVKPLVPPPDVTPHLEILKRLKREPNKSIDIDPRPVRRLDRYRKAKTALEKMETEAKEEVLNAMGDAELGTNSYSEVTNYMQNNRRLQAKDLEKAHPELAAKFKPNKPHRVLRIKKRKATK